MTTSSMLCLMTSTDLAAAALALSSLGAMVMTFLLRVPVFHTLHSSAASGAVHACLRQQACQDPSSSWHADVSPVRQRRAHTVLGVCPTAGQRAVCI